MNDMSKASSEPKRRKSVHWRADVTTPKSTDLAERILTKASPEEYSGASSRQSPLRHAHHGHSSLNSPVGRHGSESLYRINKDKNSGDFDQRRGKVERRVPDTDNINGQGGQGDVTAFLRSPGDGSSHDICPSTDKILDKSTVSVERRIPLRGGAIQGGSSPVRASQGQANYPGNVDGVITPQGQSEWTERGGYPKGAVIRNQQVVNKSSDLIDSGENLHREVGNRQRYGLDQTGQSKAKAWAKSTADINSVNVFESEQIPASVSPQVRSIYPAVHSRNLPKLRDYLHLNEPSTGVSAYTPGQGYVDKNGASVRDFRALREVEPKRERSNEAFLYAQRVKHPHTSMESQNSERRHVDKNRDHFSRNKTSPNAAPYDHPASVGSSPCHRQRYPNREGVHTPHSSPHPTPHTGPGTEGRGTPYSGNLSLDSGSESELQDLYEESDRELDCRVSDIYLCYLVTERGAAIGPLRLDIDNVELGGLPDASSGTVCRVHHIYIYTCRYTVCLYTCILYKLQGMNSYILLHGVLHVHFRVIHATMNPAHACHGKFVVPSSSWQF